MQLPRLKEWRDRRALTQSELGEAAGVSQDAISKMERGLRGCRPATGRRLAGVLGLEVGDLVAPPEVVEGDPKALVPKLLQRSLERRGVGTAWALGTEDEVLMEGERLGNEAMRQHLIPHLRQEQVALRQVARDTDVPLEVRDQADELDVELGVRMQRLLMAASHRERDPERRRKLRAEARAELLADAG